MKEHQLIELIKSNKYAKVSLAKIYAPVLIMPHIHFFIRPVLMVLVALHLFSCGEITRKVAEQTGAAIQQRDSIVNEQNDRFLSADHFEVLEVKQEDKDSLFLVRQFFVSGEKYSDTWYKSRTMRHGISKFYYRSGQLSYSLTYQNDSLMDLLESYTPEGQKRNVPPLKHGTGHVIVYHPITNNIVVDGWFKNGRKHGSYQAFYANGNKQEAGTFKNDLAESYTGWYSSGAVKSELFRAPGATKSFTYVTHYPNGRTEIYSVQKDSANSWAKKYDLNNNMVEYEVLAGGHITKQKYYYGEGNVVLSRGSYLDDKKHGNYDYFYKKGAKKSTEVYSHDTILSETKWYESGQLLFSVAYKNNAYHGWYRDYYPNGNKRVEQEYVEGIKHGAYNSFFENGKRYYEGRFADDKPLGEMKVYTRDGKSGRTKKYN
jgi:antitoxin component YwqK of YwqJK toxin-antitoxin module